MITLAGPSWRLEQIGCVLFDKDGTLIDSHLYWGRIIVRRSRALLARFRLPEDLYEPLCLAMGYVVSTGRLLPDGPVALVSREEVIEAVTVFLARLMVRPTYGEVAALFVAEHEQFHGEMGAYLRILPGVRGLLARLAHCGVPMAVVTTDTLGLTHETLSLLGINGYFTAVIGKESTTEPKITGVPALAALGLLGREPGVTVCIGDAPMDIMMAQQGGLKAGIGVASGQVGAASLRLFTPHLVDSLQELTVIEEGA